MAFSIAIHLMRDLTAFCSYAKLLRQFVATAKCNHADYFCAETQN
jgi:hypothetical protein